MYFVWPASADPLTVSSGHDVGPVGELDVFGSHVPAGGVPELVPEVLHFVWVPARRHDPLQVCSRDVISVFKKRNIHSDPMHVCMEGRAGSIETRVN